MTTPHRVELTLASLEPVAQGTCRGIDLAVKDTNDQLATLPTPVQTLLSVDAGKAGLFADQSCQSPVSGLSLASQATVFFIDEDSSLVRTVTVTAAPQDPDVAPGHLVVQTRAPATAVAAGGDNTCVVAAGLLQCWGGNLTGELGDGTRTGRVTPTQVGGSTGTMLADVTSVATGGLHSCATTQTGEVYCWGLNETGQLGDGTKTVRLSPTKIKLGDVASVGVGFQHSCALAPAGVVRCWGSDWAQQLGNGASGSSTTPVLVQGLLGVDQLAVGHDHNCALRLADGSIWCWGRNAGGQLGNGDKVDQSYPVKVSGLAVKASSVAAGGAHTCAVVDAGVQCWGANWFGQLGTGGTTSSSSPAWVVGLGSGSGVTAVAAGGNHTCAAVKGELRCWGHNRHGQLGDGTFEDRNAPVVVAGASEPTLIALAGDHTCAVAAGLVLCWGRADAGQLGRGQPLSSPVPVRVQGTGTVSHGAGGDGFTCAAQGAVLQCWGSNWSGQLGDGTQVTRATPKAVKVSGVSDVACGENHACVIVPGSSSNSEVWCWGRNSAGELGSGSFSPNVSSVPVHAPGLATLASTQIASFFRHTCAVTSAGVMCWGRNSSGELGNGSTSNASPVPTKVQNLASPVSAASAGHNHSCAAAGGGLACWGANYDGQCATGTTSAPLLTAQSSLSLLGKVTAVAAGSHFGCAVLDQAAVCWGNNWTGAVGDGSYEQRPSPVSVKSITSAVNQIAAGAGHACALASGEVWCWGNNASGQLGDDSRVTSSQPVQVTGLPGAASQVFAGHDHSCAVVAGQLWCWGSNALGELGEPWSGPVAPGPAAAWQAP